MNSTPPGYLLLLIAWLFLNAASCTDPRTKAALETPFAKNQQLWKSKNVVNYRYTLKLQCYCPIQYLGPNRIEVREGKPQSVTYIGESRNLDMKGVQLPDTIEKLFEIASPDKDTIVYNSTYGFPKSINKYGPKGTHDTSSFYSVIDFEEIKK
jgi:hypothetical protein